MILKGGVIAAAAMGDPNASIPTPQPVHYRGMFGSFGLAKGSSSMTFVSKAAAESGIKERLGLRKQIVSVANTRNIKKTDMKLNDYLPRIEVDPQNYHVYADGELMLCEPAQTVALAQRYFLF